MFITFSGPRKRFHRTISWFAFAYLDMEYTQNNTNNDNNDNNNNNTIKWHSIAISLGRNDAKPTNFHGIFQGPWPSRPRTTTS
jgi:hypothetical protein